MNRRVPAAALAGVVALGLGLAGCSQPLSPRVLDTYATSVPATASTGPAPSDPSDSPTDGPAPTAHPSDAALAPFYSQKITWDDCMSTLKCAKVTVPLDWANPTGDTIEVALAMRPAGGTKIGSLLINPGGPGGSGISLMSSLSYMVSKAVLNSYDVIGFDPRGVGQSTAVHCITDAQMDQWRAASYPLTQQGVDEMTQAAIGFGKDCQAGTGALLGFVDTNSAARDMDVIRAVVGDDTLNYLGYSYGTYLGASYAELFPQNVGRMVLDGAMDPSLDSDQMSIDQAGAFEAALGAYLKDCVGSTKCLFTSVEQGKAQIRAFVDGLLEDPLPTSDPARKLTQSLGVSGIITPLYDDGYWSFLSDGLQAAMQDHDGTALLALADLASDRNSDGTYAVNSTEANYAINCLDHPENDDPAQMASVADQLKQASPTFWDAFAYGEVMCGNWPVPPTRTPAEIRANGAAPIVVVGTTGDPATPYKWAVSLAGQLSSATLLTYQGEGHTAYGRSNKCVTQAVDGYLIEGTVPAAGTKC